MTMLQMKMAEAAGAAVDPVCGMNVDPHATLHRHSHHGHTYYFCSAGCRTKFAAGSATNAFLARISEAT